MAKSPDVLKAEAKAAKDAAKAAEDDKAQHDSDLAIAQNEAWVQVNDLFLDIMQAEFKKSRDLLDLLEAIYVDQSDDSMKNALDDASIVARAAILDWFRKAYG